MEDTWSQLCTIISSTNFDMDLVGSKGRKFKKKENRNEGLVSKVNLMQENNIQFSILLQRRPTFERKKAHLAPWWFFSFASRL